MAIQPHDRLGALNLSKQMDCFIGHSALLAMTNHHTVSGNGAPGGDAPYREMSRCVSTLKPRVLSALAARSLSSTLRARADFPRGRIRKE